MIGSTSKKADRLLVTAVITAATLALATAGLARTTTQPPHEVSCAGSGAGGCTFTVGRG